MHSPWVWIPPGSFVMGSPDSEWGRDDAEGPQHWVNFASGFWMGKYEVTQGEYLTLMGENPSHADEGPDRPVEMVSWHDAVEYCARLTARERAAGHMPGGCVYRLPTEAEWEYACRAGSNSAYSFGEDHATLSQYAWWAENGGPSPHPVGEKLPNDWGLYDMHGNVFEWCLDRYEAYPGGEIRDGQERRVVRSGAFYCPWYILRSACRLESAMPSNVSSLIGFRVVLGLEAASGGGPKSLQRVQPDRGS
ncbi:MAG: formylglycine-generating enzyme family protein [Verrucomicrobia bacterium]|nr:formylglycine-generating enzyme family protein [Verrucomicrobiota bacterium]